MEETPLDGYGLFDIPPMPSVEPVCTCHAAGYCPFHGTYQPAVEDAEVLDLFDAQSLVSSAGRRVIRKRLGGE
jgi:hypothetical protein